MKMNDLQKFDGELIENRPVIFEPPAEAENVGMNEMFKSILRRWYIVVVTFLLISFVSVPLIWLAIKPVYNVTGAIRVAPILRNIVTGEIDKGEISNYESFMNTQAELIASDRVIQRVADDLSGKNLNFFKELSSRFVERIKNRIDNVSTQQDPAVVLKQAITEGIITVAPARRTELIKITVENKNSREAEQIVNAFINNYTAVQSTIEMQDGAIQMEQLKKYQKELEEKIKGERQQLRSVQEYVTTTSGGPRDTTLPDQISVLVNELTKVEADGIRLETKITLSEQMILKEAASRDPNKYKDVNSPAELLAMRAKYIDSDMTVQSLTKTADQMELNLLMAKLTLASENPDLKQKQELYDMFKARLDEQRRLIGERFDQTFAKTQQRAGNQNVSKDLFLLDRAELEAKKEFEKRLKERIAEVKAKLDAESSQNINLGLKQLDIQDVDFQIGMDQDNLKRILKRMEELEMELKQPARISVAYLADISSINDKRVKLTMAILFGSLFCGVMLAYMRDKTDKRLHTPEEVTKRIGVRVIGTTASQQGVKRALLPQQIEQDYQTIWANLGLLDSGKIPKELVITSPGRSEGKTTFSVNLASSIAKSGKKVLLIDGDLRKPDIANILKLPDKCRGLRDVLAGVPLSQVVCKVSSNGLDVLIADSTSGLSPLQILTLPNLALSVRGFAQIYDHVIIDTPPLLAFPDALLWAKMGDAVILTSFAGRTTAKDLEDAKGKLFQVNIRLLGTVLSNVQPQAGYYRYGSSYHVR
jgi:polysaccharide biosynthesis transport protein